MTRKLRKATIKYLSFDRRWGSFIFIILFLCAAAVIVAAGYFITQNDREKERIASMEKTFTVQEDAMAKTPLYTRLEQSGISRKEIYDITQKLDTIMHTRRIRPQDSFMLSLNEEGGFSMLVVTRDLSRYFVAKVSGELVGGIIDIEIKTRQKEASGLIQGSLYNSMLSEGMIVPLIISFTDVFSWNIDFNSETRNGDKYAVIWEEDYTLNDMIVDQRILSAKYEGSYAGTNYAFGFEDDFYDESGKVTQRMFLKSPISFKGVRITSRFNPRRKHPILRIVRPHNGIDYAAPSGTPVEAVADGSVIFAGRRGGYGNFVEVKHANNFVTGYGHLKSYSVKKGEKVKQGNVIAHVGSTGLSTGPHLDFSIKESGKYIDFLSLKNRNSSIREIPKEKLKDFEKVRNAYKAILDKPIEPAAQQNPAGNE